MAEFWPHERWPASKLLIPEASAWRKGLCIVMGHTWATHYWSGMNEVGWPQHEYCETCWKFRDKEDQSGTGGSGSSSSTGSPSSSTKTG